MLRKIFAALATAAILALVVQPALAQTSTLTGSWQLTLVPNLPPGPPIIPIAGLANFTSDGGAVATAAGVIVGSDPSLSGTGLNPAFGNWNGAVIPGEFAIVLVGDITAANGALVATRNFRALVTFPQSNEFTGSYTLTITDTSGNVLSSGSGTITGNFIPHFLPPGS